MKFNYVPVDNNSIIVDTEDQLSEYTTSTTINMTDTLTQKPKLQLRSGLSFSEKTPSPSAKLMINHGKPNFTIQRTPKSPQLNGNGNGNANPLSPTPKSASPSPTPPANGVNGLANGGSLKIINNNNNNEITFKNANVNGQSGVEVSVKTQKFNGVVKPANVPLTAEQGNEVAKVVLRHVNRSMAARDGADEDDSVPEFIRRQRRIQERLAKEGLDFENRRSGYFTQVLISPTTPNQRTSFVETMSSPAIVPALEMPPPIPSTTPPPTPKQLEEVAEDELIPAAVAAVTTAALLPDAVNGHAQVEQDEVADAIEEMNKAVAGEDDEVAQDEPLIQIAASTTEVVSPPVEEVKTAAAVAVGEIVEAAVAQVQETVTNGHAEEAAAIDADVTILHTNGDVSAEAAQQSQGPSIPTPDPSGALGVNYEPKTVVSFSKDLGSEPNKYPDTVRVVEGSTDAAPVDGELAEMAKLKFDIKADEQDVQVTPVLRSE